MTMSNPEFIDNREGNTLGHALALILGGVPDEKGVVNERPAELAVASAFFTPAGLATLAPRLEGLKRVRLMFGVEAPRDFDLRRPDLGEPRDMFEARLVRDGLRQADTAVRAARDRFPFTREGINALRRLIARLKDQNVEARRYERTFLHAKAYIFVPADGAADPHAGIIAGSSNLTGAGLGRNLELNLGRYGDPIVQRALQWFDALWDEAEPVDLAEPFEEIFTQYMPWEIFLRILFQLYGAEVAEDERQDGGLPLTSFQNHGAARAMRLIHDCGGALVADEVGLGKTYIAADIIREYHKRRQRALLICPAQLRDTTWSEFLARHQMDVSVECVSYEELANDVQLHDPRNPRPPQVHLKRPLSEYQLVVVDEAHNYRNPDTATRAAILRRLLFGQKRDLLLLTATPVNNSLWDLYHLIHYFIRQEAYLASRGILSIYDRFRVAMRQDPSNLSPDLLYPIIDATCVKRTRQFVKKHYAGDTIVGLDGRRHPIVFPRPEPITVRYALDPPLPELFDKIEQALDPDTGTLSFARYAAESFRKEREDHEEDARIAATIGLLRSGLLKRFESSSAAFLCTLENLIKGHGVFLEALAKGRVVTTQFLHEVAADDERGIDDLLAAGTHSEDASLYDVGRLRAAVENDLKVLESLAEDARRIVPERDPKLRALVGELEKIAVQATEEATDTIDEAQNRKVLLFSFFADTVKYVRNFLGREIERNPKLKGYWGRIAAVSGDDDLEEFSRYVALFGFAPKTTQAPPGQDADLYDILVTTDVLAEGVNLQQCRHIINLDIPWNPMRLVQRHGRIDRIGSPYTRVYLRTIFPAARLNDLLNLEQRILAKIAMAAASIGVAAPVAGASHGEQVFTETREEIERLLREDSSLYERGGTASAAQTGEEYRQTLRKALAENRDRVVNVPMKAGSGMAKGKDRGVLFCAQIDKRTYLRFVRTDEGWRPATGEGSIEHELGTCLRLAECEPEVPRVVPKSLADDLIFDLWAAAQSDIWRSWMVETDPANLQPKVRPLNRRVAEFIRANPPTDVDTGRLTQALDVLESPWPRREEMLLREWFDDENRSGAAKAAYLIEQILNTGLEPYREPPTLPPIRLEDIDLVCWLAISPAH